MEALQDGCSLICSRFLAQNETKQLEKYIQAFRFSILGFETKVKRFSIKFCIR